MSSQTTAPTCIICRAIFRNRSDLKNHQSQPRGHCFAALKEIREAELREHVEAGLALARAHDRQPSLENTNDAGGAVELTLLHRASTDLHGDPAEWSNPNISDHNMSIDDVYDPNNIDQDHLDDQEGEWDENSFDLDVQIPGSELDPGYLSHFEDTEDGNHNDYQEDISDDRFGAEPEEHLPAHQQVAAANYFGRALHKEEHPKQSQLLGLGQTIIDRFNQDAMAGKRQEQPYYPFESFEDWQLACALDRLDVSIPKLDDVLRTEIMKIQSLTSRFKHGAALRTAMENLPGEQAGVSPWMSKEITVDGYPTVDPIQLFYRNTAECLQALFGNPIFAKHMTYTPFKLFDGTGTRIYTEWMSGDSAWNTQDRLPNGATVLGCIASSDKTALTSHTGSKVAHPLLLSLANIDMAVRNRSSYHAFLLIALLPIPKFFVTDKKLLSVLYHRVIHTCLDIVFSPLKKIAREGTVMTDPEGRNRFCYTPLASYMVDNPEALMLAGVMGWTSPVTMASYKSFGDPHPHPRRHGYATVEAIQHISTLADPWNEISKFINISRRFRLSGVHKPFFRDWDHSDPTWFLTPDRLHGLLKKFWDHDLQWCIGALGANELDFRFMALQPKVGLRHFDHGVSKLKMTSGREHRDIQRSIVGIITGGTSLEFLRCIRALVDFFYVSQQEMISEHDITALQQLLNEFHTNKQAVLDEGLRQREIWSIPKIELLHSVPLNIIQNGAARQWSTDRTEHAHIEVVKKPFRATNHRAFNPQICRYLDRAEKRRNFDLCTAIIQSNASIQPALEATNERVYGWLKEIKTTESLTAPGRDATDYFKAAELVEELLENDDIPQKKLTRQRSFCTASTAFHLNASYDEKLSIQEASIKFQLNDLHAALIDFWKGVKALGGWVSAGRYPVPNEGISEAPIGMRRRGVQQDERLPFTHIRVWYQFRVQTKTAQNGDVTAAKTVKAAPPSGKYTYGRFDSCLFLHNPFVPWTGKINPDLKDASIGEIHLIFQPVISHTVIKSAPYLVYAERFDSMRHDDTYYASHLPRLKRSQRMERGVEIRRGGVIAMERILTAVDIMPYFGQTADGRLSAYNSIQMSRQFLLNIYTDKHVHSMFN